ncbi:ATP-binding protein [Gemmatimonadetes bacterium T265]|nr:ATP-binding protein [Gemmatimonadetes bacterium T265]
MSREAPVAIPPARSFFFPDARQSPAAEVATETLFFRHLRLPNGTYKTTYPDRMPDVDAAVAAALPPGTRVRVLDVGVSSGVTTLELADALAARGLAADVVAVDLSVSAFLHRRAGVDLLSDPNGRVLQIATPFGVKGRPHDPEGSLARTALQRVFEGAERLIGGPGGARRGTPVQLVSPRLVRRPGTTVVEHDLANPRAEWVGGFDVVRAANVLNHDYFDVPTLRRMLGHLETYVRPHGLLVLCRTHDDTRTNHASVLRRAPDGRFGVVTRVGNGSEVESLVLEPVAA